MQYDGFTGNPAYAIAVYSSRLRGGECPWNIVCRALRCARTRDDDRPAPMRLSSSLAENGVIGPVTRVYPDNGAHALHGPETRRRLHVLLCCVGNGFGNSSISLLGTPRRRENGVGSPADADMFLGV